MHALSCITLATYLYWLLNVSLIWTPRVFGKISAQPHTTLCIQFLDRENNDKSNRLPLGGNFTEFFVRTKNITKSIHVNIFFLLWSFLVTLDSEAEYQGPCWLNFYLENCSFSESSITLQYHSEVSFIDRCWNEPKNVEHHMVISLGIWKSKLFLIIPSPANISPNKVIKFFVET